MAQFFLTAIRVSGEGHGHEDRPIPKVVSLDTTLIVKTIPQLTSPSDTVQRTIVKTARGGGRREKSYVVAENLGEVTLMQDFTNSASSPYNTGTKANVAAAGTAQGTATAVTAYHNTVTAACASPSLFGVRLPNASTALNLGRAMVVKNAATAGITVYPAASEILDSTSTASVTIAPGFFKHFYCSATNKWVTGRGPYV
jgi:hypothetical protein